MHTTGPLGVECVFHDYVNLLIGVDPSDGLTTLIAFSISQQAGALGDDGQVWGEGGERDLFFQNFGGMEGSLGGEVYHDLFFSSSSPFPSLRTTTMLSQLLNQPTLALL